MITIILILVYIVQVLLCRWLDRKVGDHDGTWTWLIPIYQTILILALLLYLYTDSGYSVKYPKCIKRFFNKDLED